MDPNAGDDCPEDEPTAGLGRADAPVGSGGGGLPLPCRRAAPRKSLVLADLSLNEVEALD